MGIVSTTATSGGLGITLGGDDFGESPEEKKARDEAAAAEAQRLSGAYKLAPNDPNYVARTGVDIRQTAESGANVLETMGVGSYNVGAGANQALTQTGQKAQGDIVQWGQTAGNQIADTAEDAQQALTQAGLKSSQAINKATTAGQQTILGATNLGAKDLAAAGQNAQSAITGYGQQQAGALTGAGASALDQIGTYGQQQAGALGALGASAAQVAAAQGQNAAQIAAQQGRAVIDQSALAAGDIAGGAIAQSGAIDRFAAQQAAAAAAAQGRQFVDPNFAAANVLYGTAGTSAADLAALEAVEGPSAAQAQLQAGLNATQAQALALARSGRGMGGSASALSQAAGQAAAAGQQAANQSAMLRAQEAAAWRQRQAANLGAAAGIQTALGQQTQGQTEFGSEIGLRQQALADQTALGYGSQALQGLTGAGDLALQGRLGGGQLALQGGTAGGDLALRGALGGGELGLSGADLEGRLATQGAQLGLNALQSGQSMNLQALQAATDAGQRGLETGYGMGMQGTQAASDTRMQGALAASGMGFEGAQAAADAKMRGLETGYGMGIQGMQAGADVGLRGMETGYGMGLDAIKAGAEAELGGMAQAGALYGAGTQQRLEGIGQENTLYAQEAGLLRSEVQDDLTRYGIDKGVAVQQSAQDQAMLGGMVSAGAAMLPLLMAASDRDAKENIKPAGEIVLPMASASKLDSVPTMSGARGGFGPVALGPGGPAYDRAMGKAADAERKIRTDKARMEAATEGAMRGIQQAGSIMGNVPTNPYMFNPYAQQYLASDVNSKTEIEQLKGQVLALGGQPPPSMQPAGVQRTAAPMQEAGQPGTGYGVGQMPMPATRPVAAPAPNTMAQPQAAAARPTMAPSMGPARPAQFATSTRPAQDPTMQPAPQADQGMRADTMRRMPTSGFVASDERSKMRIAQLEDQVSVMGGNPNDSREDMPLVFDPRDKIYRPYAPEAERTGGFVRGEGPRPGFDVGEPAYNLAALDEAYSREGGDYVPSSPAQIAAAGRIRDIDRTDFFRGNDRVLGSGAEIYNPYGQVDVSALDDAYRRQTGGEPTMPTPEAAARAISKAPAFEYEYKDPKRHGAGRYIGPMAQNLEETPAGRSVVFEGPDQTKMVDTSRLSLLNTAALHQMQERIDELESENGGSNKPLTREEADESIRSLKSLRMDPYSGPPPLSPDEVERASRDMVYRGEPISSSAAPFSAPQMTPEQAELSRRLFESPQYNPYEGFARDF